MTAKQKKEAEKAPRYRVLIGVDYPEGRRAEVGDIVDDLPREAIKNLLAEAAIEEVD